jgi:hypothetical protein
MVSWTHAFQNTSEVYDQGTVAFLKAEVVKIPAKSKQNKRGRRASGP